MTDTSPEAVERFDINWRDYRKDIDANGDYVTYEDYAALSAQLADLTAELEYTKKTCKVWKDNYLALAPCDISDEDENFCGNCKGGMDENVTDCYVCGGTGILPTDTPAAKVTLERKPITFGFDVSSGPDETVVMIRNPTASVLAALRAIAGGKP
jgi:hypothetical protein